MSPLEWHVVTGGRMFRVGVVVRIRATACLVIPDRELPRKDIGQVAVYHLNIICG